MSQPDDGDFAIPGDNFFFLVLQYSYVRSTPTIHHHVRLLSWEHGGICSLEEKKTWIAANATALKDGVVKVTD